MYKFNSCNTRYWNKISHFLADEYIDRIGSRIVPYKEKHFDNQHMGSLKLESSLFSKSCRNDSCVIDYVWSQVRGKMGFKT